MKILDFVNYLSKLGYRVNSCPESKDYIVFSNRLYLGAFQPDRGNIVFWFNDNAICPARDIMLDGIDTSEMRICYPYIHIFVIKGFREDIPNV